MVSNDAIVGIVGVLVGSLLAYWFVRVSKSADDRQQARGLLTAVHRDVVMGVRHFGEYGKPVTDPAWRLPTSAWTAAFSFLASIRALSADEIATLADFFDVAVQMNYCLDCVADPARAGHQIAEVNRARIKVEHAIDPKPPYSEPLTARALSAIDAALTRLG